MKIIYNNIVKSLTLLGLLFASSAIFAQSASCNDVGGAELTVGGSCVQTNMNSTNSSDYWNSAAGCGADDSDDVWAWFTATATTTTIEYQPAGNRDAILTVLTGACSPTMASLACSNTGGNGVTEIVTGPTVIGQVYRIRVQRNGSNNNMNGQICVHSPVAAPANDECTGAEALAVAPTMTCTPVAGTVEGATASPIDATNCSGNEDNDVWYSFVATDNVHVVGLFNVAGSDTDMYTSLWEGNCAGNALTPVDGTNNCDDDDTGQPLTGLTPGNTYFVRVNTYFSAPEDTDFDICIATPVPCAPDQTINTTMFSQSLTTCGAGDDYSSGDACGFTNSYLDGEDYTIAWTPTTSECVDINVTGTGTHTALFITDDCPGRPGHSCIASNEEATGNPSRENFNVVAGTTYYLTISTDDNAGPGCTAFDIEVAACPPPDSFNDCSGANQVCTDDTFTGNTTGSGNVADLTGANRGCLSTEHQSSWYVFKTGTSGNLELTIQTTVDYDFALWGPYADNSDCPPSAAPIRCSFAGGGGDTGMVNGSGDFSEGAGGDRFVNGLGVLADQVFILLVDNFVANGTNFTLDWNFNSGATLDCAPLSVIFSDFEVTNLGGDNIIHWNTYKEENNSHFLVQKRDENGEYYTIQNVNATESNSDESKPYIVTDRNVENVINYYRVVQVDLNGKTKIYDPKSVDNRDNTSEVIKTFNLLGQEVDAYFEGIVIQLHQNGSTTKVYQNPE